MSTGTSQRLLPKHQTATPRTDDCLSPIHPLIKPILKLCPRQHTEFTQGVTIGLIQQHDVLGCRRALGQTSRNGACTCRTHHRQYAQ